MKRSPYTVGDLIKVLQCYDPSKPIRLWDMGYGGHVPLVEVCEDSIPGALTFEGATKEEMDIERFK